jgi:hypothetical protein
MTMPNTFKITDYKGKPVANILVSVDNHGKEYWMMFGKKKAQAIIENIEAVKKFAEGDSAPKEMPDPSEDDMPF